MFTGYIYRVLYIYRKDWRVEVGKERCDELSQFTVIWSHGYVNRLKTEGKWQWHVENMYTYIYTYIYIHHIYVYHVYIYIYHVYIYTYATLYYVYIYTYATLYYVYIHTHTVHQNTWYIYRIFGYSCIYLYIKLPGTSTKIRVPWWLSGALSVEFRQDLSLLALMGLELSESTNIVWKWVSRFPIHHENLIESQRKRRSLLFWCWFMFLSFRGKVYTKFPQRVNWSTAHFTKVRSLETMVPCQFWSWGSWVRVATWFFDEGLCILIVGLWFDHNQLIWFNMNNQSKWLWLFEGWLEIIFKKNGSEWGRKSENTRVNNGKIIRYIVI